MSYYGYGGGQGMLKAWPERCGELWITMDVGGWLGVPWCKVHTLYNILHALDGLICSVLESHVSGWGLACQEWRI